MKAVNSAAKPVLGHDESMQLGIGPWHGRANFTIDSLDYYKVVLSMEFFEQHKVVPMAHLGILVFMGGQTMLGTHP